MTSLKQIEANRRNALKSTGPMSPEGKERSRCNAVRHGLTAETVVAALEDGEDYQAFEAAVIVDYNADTAVERELALRLASVLWRLRRATGIETALFEFSAEELGQAEPAYTGPALIAGADLRPEDNQRTEKTRLSDAPAKTTQRNIGDAFLRLVSVSTFPLDRLSRYEHNCGGRLAKSFSH